MCDSFVATHDLRNLLFLLCVILWLPYFVNLYYELIITSLKLTVTNDVTILHYILLNSIYRLTEYFQAVNLKINPSLSQE